MVTAYATSGRPRRCICIYIYIYFLYTHIYIYTYKHKRYLYMDTDCKKPRQYKHTVPPGPSLAAVATLARASWQQPSKTAGEPCVRCCQNCHRRRALRRETWPLLCQKHDKRQNGRLKYIFVCFSACRVKAFPLCG